MKLVRMYNGADIKTEMSFQEFYELGLLQEINRQILHPMGLSMEVALYEDGSNVEFTRIIDFRSDPEGLYSGDSYSGLDAIGKGKSVKSLFNKKRKQRMKKLGYHVQPITKSRKK